ncbi:alpha-tocopherol transfer protein-like [Rhodnius prolixus]|uniref:alpha-tocopherol transfer protein-like n=1 Tax=Rhodnius prolixus TaxID=13249 RepID=UPI003D18C891
MQLKDFPFRGGGCEVPNERKEDVASIRKWLKHQAHLPQITDEHIMLFLHSNYFSVEKTKNTIETYFVVRAENPELFCNWDITALEQAFRIYELSPLPKTSPEGYKILLYRLKDNDPSKFIFQEGMRVFFAFNDVRISEDGIVPGYIVLFDMKGCTLSHLARVSTVMYLVKTFMLYIQDCHPVRLKGVHVLNTASFMDKVLTLIKPLMQSELVKLLHLHSSMDTLKKFVPLELLPEEYGGDCKSGSFLHEEHYKLMKSDYSVWLKESGDLVADLKKRPQKKKITDNMQGSFRTLSID